jgi:TonB family protein
MTASRPQSAPPRQTNRRCAPSNDRHPCERHHNSQKKRRDPERSLARHLATDAVEGPPHFVFALAIAVIFALFIAPTLAQAQTNPSSNPPSSDPALNLASNLTGKALFLRSFYADDDLIYQVSGRIVGTPKTTDWTLAAINIQKAERHGNDEIELTGLRAAVRYNAKNQQFERRPIAAEPVRILIGTLPPEGSPMETEQFNRALAAIFSIGIDPALQRSTPTYWRHYFDAALPWDKDSLTGVHIFTPGSAPPNSPDAEQLKRLVNPVPENEERPRYTDLALRDEVAGEIELRMVVDSDGVPRRFAITRPIGYGLDARAVGTIATWRFHPGTLDGKPVPMTILLREDFDLRNAPRP